VQPVPTTANSGMFELVRDDIRVFCSHNVVKTAEVSRSLTVLASLQLSEHSPRASYPGITRGGELRYKPKGRGFDSR